MKRTFLSQIQEFLDTNRNNVYRLKPYLVRDGKTHPVAIVIPGGGYRRICNFSEGYPYAKKLNAMGCHAFVLYYHVREYAHYPAPQKDLVRAVKEIMAHADQWKLDMDGYSVWGSSAGGHLAASFGTEAMGYTQYGLPKPGALVLTYPVVTMGEKTHEGSRNFLIGREPDEETVRLTSVEKQVTPAYPPTFLWWGAEDDCVDPANSRMLKDALEEKHIPSLCTQYPATGHGVGIGEGLPCEGWFEKAVQFWEEHR